MFDITKTIVIAIILVLLYGCASSYLAPGFTDIDAPHMNCFADTFGMCSRASRAREARRQAALDKESAARNEKFEKLRVAHEEENDAREKRYMEWRRRNPAEAARMDRLYEIQMREFLKPNIFGCPGNLRPSSSMPGACGGQTPIR